MSVTEPPARKKISVMATPSSEPEGQTLCCPLCGVQLKADELNTHYQLELQRIRHQVATSHSPVDMLTGEGRRRGQRGAALQARKRMHVHVTSKDPGIETEDKARIVLEKVRRNRKARSEGSTQEMINGRSSRRGTTTPATTHLNPGSNDTLSTGPTCPICGCELEGNEYNINEHIDTCLAGGEQTYSPRERSCKKKKTVATKRERESNERKVKHSVEVEEEQGFETYTWAGQTRVRAVTMMESGWQGAGFQTTKRGEEEEEDLDIEDDESQHFGTIQYNEMDMIPCGTDSGPEDSMDADTLRSMLATSGTPVSRQSPDTTNSQWEGDNGGKVQTTTTSKEVINTNEEENEGEHESEHGVVTGARSGDMSAALIIASLKANIIDLERQVEEGSSKCLVCLGPYTKPVVSVKCWHVHCENCWLHTLGAKKLCPQCTIITVPGDLRRIYL